MIYQTSEKFSGASVKIEICEATDALRKEYDNLRSERTDGRRTFNVWTEDREEHGEQSYFILANNKPAVWFQTNRQEYADGKRITLMNIEALPNNPIKSRGSKIALDAVERMAQNENLDLVVLDRPLESERTCKILARRGYEIGFDEDPKKYLNKLTAR